MGQAQSVWSGRRPVSGRSLFRPPGHSPSRRGGGSGLYRALKPWTSSRPFYLVWEGQGFRLLGFLSGGGVFAMALRSLISRSPSSVASLSVLFSVRAFASKSVPCCLAGRPSQILRLRPLVSALWSPTGLALGGDGLRCFSTRPTTSSLNDPSPNWSNRPPKETILLDGCDFEHWLVVMEPPEGEPTRDEIIDSYIKTLAQIVGRFQFPPFVSVLHCLSLYL